MSRRIRKEPRLRPKSSSFSVVFPGLQHMLSRYRTALCGPSDLQHRHLSTVRAAEWRCQHSGLTATVSLFPDLHSASSPIQLRLRRLCTVHTVTVPWPTVTTFLMCCRQRRTALHQPLLAYLLQGAATLRSRGLGRIFEGCIEQAVPASPFRHHFPTELTALAVEEVKGNVCSVCRYNVSSVSRYDVCNVCRYNVCLVLVISITKCRKARRIRKVFCF